MDTRATPDPAVLRYDVAGRPVYRRAMAPEGLDTAAQLRARRLSPAGLEPVAWLYYAFIGHQVCALYDRAQARPIRPLSERQRQALAEGRRLANTVPCTRCGEVRVSVWDQHYCEPCQQVVTAERAERYAAWERRMQQDAEDHEWMLREDRAAAASWAGAALIDPAMVVLDTETTGLLHGPDPAYMVEIAVVAGDETVLLDTLVHPQVPIPPAATAIHGITDAMVADAPTFSEILPELTRVLTGRRVITYNAAFDGGILRRELERHYRNTDPGSAPELWGTHPSADQWMSALRADCAMTWHAQWFGEWHDYHQSYTWQPLGGGHRANGDCAATLARLRLMSSPDVDSVLVG